MITERKKKIARKIVQKQLDSIAKELTKVAPEHQAGIYAKAEKILSEHKSMLEIPLEAKPTRKSTNSKSAITCPECGCNISSGNLEKHISRVHSPEGQKRRLERAEIVAAKKITREELVSCEICKTQVKRKHLKKHMRDAHNIGVKLRLISKRGSRVPGLKTCSGCKEMKSETWLYKESTKGPVHLCALCKTRYFDSSFGKKDALDYCSFGGGFESNRRRH
jgi:hypothetical protein